MLSSSAGVRNLLQGERPGTSPRSGSTVLPVFCSYKVTVAGQGATPLPWGRCRQERLAPKGALSQTTAPGYSCLFQNQMLVHQQAHRGKSRGSA